MLNELELINSDLMFEKITVTSLEKLENNYVRFIGKSGYKDIDIVTNGIYTLNFSSFVKIKNIVNYNEIDYMIAENIFGEAYLISLNDGKRIIKRAKQINYIGNGLFGVSNKEEFSVEKVFDLITNDYVPIPDNMIFKDYKEDILVLQESNKKSYEKHYEVVINRSGDVIIPKIEGSIKIIDRNKFITNNMIIDFNQKAIIQDTDLVMPLTEDKLMILKNRKLFILNNTLEVIKTYSIGETKPWYVVIKNEECIIMSFKKKIRAKKYEPRLEKDITVMVNIKTDTITKLDFIPTLSPYDVFKIVGENLKKGLMNKKGEILLDIEWDKIEELHDKENKYFFIEKDDEHYIFNSQTREKLKVSYTEMQEYQDGLSIGYNPDLKRYHLLDEELNILFDLEHMGHSKFYYKNGILCYHSGSWINEYDAYTIITQSGEVLMPSRRCTVKRNGFELLEIEDYQTDKKILFNMNSGQFVQLEINVPIKDTDNGRELDFSRMPIQQSISDSQVPLLEEDMQEVRRLLLKSKKNEDL